MGNISSNQGNNSLPDGTQTPLNKFIEKVMNEEYFFTPNVSDDMITKVNKNENSNKHVLFKRATCTGTNKIPISLPHVTCNDNGICDQNIYTVNIDVTDKDGNKLPDIQTIPPDNLQEAYDNLTDIIAGTKDINNFTGDDSVSKSTMKLYEYNTAIIDFFNKNPETHQGTTLDWGFQVQSKHSKGSRIGSTKGCKLFYTGTLKDIKYETSNNPNHYNSFDEGAGLSNSKAFCGKVLQYNDLVDDINGSLNNVIGVSERVGRFSQKNDGNENEYRTDNFKDCACLNSMVAVERNKINYIQEEAIRLAKQRGETVNVDSGINLTGAKLAQNNDPYCKSNLHDGKPGAYASQDETTSANLNVCQSISLIQGIDQTGGNVDAGMDCGFSESDESKIRKCLENPNAPGCKPKEESDDGGESTDKDKNKGNMTIIIVVVILLILAGVGFYFYKKNKGSSSGESQPLIKNATIKYNKPSSDPLYR